MKQCFIYQITIYNDTIREQIDKIVDDLVGADIDFYVLYNIYYNNQNSIDNFIHLREDYTNNKFVKIETFTIDEVTKDTVYYKNSHICIFVRHDFAFDYIYSLPILWFYKKHSEYKYYWRFEQDIIYNGNYLDFINSFNDNTSDLLCSHLYDITGFDRYKYNLFVCGKFKLPFKINKYYKCLVNACRISNAGIQKIDQITKTKRWYGYDEVLLPTFFIYDGLSVHDFNEFGEYYIIGEQDIYHHVYHKNTIQNIPQELSSISMYAFDKYILDILTYKNKLIHRCNWLK